MKEQSRKLYVKAFNLLREFLGGKDLDVEPPSEHDLLAYFRFLRLEKKMASSSLWTTYSKINSMCKAKYALDMKRYYRVARLIKTFDGDLPTKARIFSVEEIDKFIRCTEISSPYWLVRKACACVAFYGGLRLSEAINLQIENFQSTADGIYVTFSRSKNTGGHQDVR